MNVIIVGANFGNKGAQSMLFTTVAAIRRKYPDAKIFFAHANGTPCLNENFLFEEIHYNKYNVKVSAEKIDFTPPPNQFVDFVAKDGSNFPRGRFNR